jgi:hypothetical protein
MARTSTRQTAELALAGLMAISLPAAIVGGTLAIIRFGEPDGATAAYLAEMAAWAFAAAFLGSFALAIAELLSRRPLET